MVRTPSTMLLPIGTEAPSFRLPDPSGTLVGTDDFGDAPALLVMFICNHCPYVRLVRSEIAAIGREYGREGVAIIAVNSNDTTAHPDDSPEMMALEIEEHGYTFPYLFDESQDVAKTYRAACTPDFFVFDADRKLAYRGQLDGARPGNGVEPSGADLRAALDHVLAGEAVPEPHTPSLGCNIKWRPGNEPAY